MNLLSNIESHPWKCLFIEIMEKYCDAVMKINDLFCEPWPWFLWEVTDEVDVQRKMTELEWLLKLLAKSHQYLRVDNTIFSREVNCPSYSQIETHSLTKLVFWWRVSSRMLLCSSGSTCSSVQFSLSVVSDSLWPHGLQHTRPPCPSPTPGVYSNSCPLSRWCHQTISSSVVPFSSRLQSFPASGSFQMSQVASIGVSASASVLPMNIKDWFPLRWTDWISL